MLRWFQPAWQVLQEFLFSTRFTCAAGCLGKRGWGGALLASHGGGCMPDRWRLAAQSSERRCAPPLAPEGGAGNQARWSCRPLCSFGAWAWSPSALATLSPAFVLLQIFCWSQAFLLDHALHCRIPLPRPRESASPRCQSWGVLLAVYCQGHMQARPWQSPGSRSCSSNWRGMGLPGCRLEWRQAEVRSQALCGLWRGQWPALEQRRCLLVCWPTHRPSASAAQLPPAAPFAELSLSSSLSSCSCSCMCGMCHTAELHWLWELGLSSFSFPLCSPLLCASEPQASACTRNYCEAPKYPQWEAHRTDVWAILITFEILPGVGLASWAAASVAGSSVSSAAIASPVSFDCACMTSVHHFKDALYWFYKCAYVSTGGTCNVGREECPTFFLGPGLDFSLWRRPARNPMILDTGTSHSWLHSLSWGSSGLRASDECSLHAIKWTCVKMTHFDSHASHSFSQHSVVGRRALPYHS